MALTLSWPSERRLPDVPVARRPRLLIRPLYLLKVALEPFVHPAEVRDLPGAGVELAAVMVAFSDLRSEGRVAVEGLVHGIGADRHGGAREAGEGHGEGGEEGQKQAQAAAGKSSHVVQERSPFVADVVAHEQEGAGRSPMRAFVWGNLAL